MTPASSIPQAMITIWELWAQATALVPPVTV